jgi:hypothetical protein
MEDFFVSDLFVQDFGEFGSNLEVKWSFKSRWFRIDLVGVGLIIQRTAYDPARVDSSRYR